MESKYVHSVVNGIYAGSTEAVRDPQNPERWLIPVGHVDCEVPVHNPRTQFCRFMGDHFEVENYPQEVVEKKERDQFLAHAGNVHLVNKIKKLENRIGWFVARGWAPPKYWVTRHSALGKLIFEITKQEFIDSLKPNWLTKIIGVFHA